MEFQHGVCRNNPWDSLISIGEMRRNTKASLAAYSHAFNAIFQSGNYAPFTNAERVFLVLPHQLTAIQEQVVANINFCTAIGSSAVPDFDVFVFNATATAFHRQAA